MYVIDFFQNMIKKHRIPVLIYLILNIFIKAFDKKNINDNWKKNFIEQLIRSKYEVILFNTFIHALPDVRIEILKFLFQIHKKLVEYKKIDNIYKDKRADICWLFCSVTDTKYK